MFSRDKLLQWYSLAITEPGYRYSDQFFKNDSGVQTTTLKINDVPTLSITIDIDTVKVVDTSIQPLQTKEWFQNHGTLIETEMGWYYSASSDSTRDYRLDPSFIYLGKHLS